MLCCGSEPQHSTVKWIQIMFVLFDNNWIHNSRAEMRNIFQFYPNLSSVVSNWQENNFALNWNEVLNNITIYKVLRLNLCPSEVDQMFNILVNLLNKIWYIVKYLINIWSASDGQRIRINSECINELGLPILYFYRLNRKKLKTHNKEWFISVVK